MMVMTAKVNLKKILLGLAAAAAVIIGLVLLLGNGESAQTAAPSLSGNDARVQFLKGLGWEVAASPIESGQVKIPKEQSEKFDRYNTLQKSQGYDLSQYAGKSVMRYMYKVTNYPNATEPVYATLLVYKDQVIGGDITDTSARGKIQPLLRQNENTVPDPTSATEPSATVPGNI